MQPMLKNIRLRDSQSAMFESNAKIAGKKTRRFLVQ